MFQKGYLIWGTCVCLGLMMAQAAGWKTPSLSGGSGAGYYGSGGSGGSSRGSGGFWGFGGGK